MAVFYTSGRVDGNAGVEYKFTVPTAWQRDEPELIAERHDLITQIEHNSGSESW